jgi:protein-L-isoaspartate(D-aspartate) O-methyltransferase
VAVADALSLADAIAKVEWESFVRLPDGSQFPQSSRSDVVMRVLELLDVQPSQRVFEVGTGSGYSTALLALLVGDDGSVVSIDHAPETLEHAGARLAFPFPRVRLVEGDGQNGFEGLGPYDRIVPWASVEEVPDQRFEQVVPHGVVVVPLLHEGRVARFRRGSSEWEREADVSGTFIPLTAEPVRPRLEC